MSKLQTIVDNFKSNYDHLNISEYTFENFTKAYYDDYSIEEKEKYKSLFLFLENLKDAILIQDVYIKEESEGKGITSKMVYELKNLGKTIILYSADEAIEYWEKVGFKNVDSYVYKFETCHK